MRGDTHALPLPLSSLLPLLHHCRPLLLPLSLLLLPPLLVQLGQFIIAEAAAAAATAAAATTKKIIAAVAAVKIVLALKIVEFGRGVKDASAAAGILVTTKATPEALAWAVARPVPWLLAGVAVVTAGGGGGYAPVPGGGGGGGGGLGGGRGLGGGSGGGALERLHPSDIERPLPRALHNLLSQLLQALLVVPALRLQPPVLHLQLLVLILQPVALHQQLLVLGLQRRHQSLILRKLAGGLVCLLTRRQSRPAAPSHSAHAVGWPLRARAFVCGLRATRDCCGAVLALRRERGDPLLAVSVAVQLRQRLAALGAAARRAQVAPARNAVAVTVVTLVYLTGRQRETHGAFQRVGHCKFSRER